MYFEAIYILFLGMRKNSVHTSNGLLFLALCLELYLPFPNGSIKAHIYISLFDIHSALMLLLIIDVCIFTISMAVTILSTFNRTHHSFFNGMFGCKKKKGGRAE